MALVVLTFLCACADEAAPPAEITPPVQTTAAHEVTNQQEQPQAKAEEKPALPARRFVRIEGEVKIDGKQATTDQEIPQVASINTGKASHAVITLQPGSIIELRPNTQVKLGKSERKANSLELLFGKVWSFLPKGASYEVVTENAVAGVRGTVFFVEADKKHHTYVCACDGEVTLAAGAGKPPRKVISHHEHKSFSVRGKKGKTSPAKRRDHTDEQAQQLEALIAETQAK